MAKGKSEGDGDDSSKTNLIRRIREMKFFSLDETDFKITQANWLEYVCWQPSVHDSVKRQNNIFSNHFENPIDSLLQSSFDFIDVNEAGATNKILEDASLSHLRKVKQYFTEISLLKSQESPSQAESTEKQILSQAIQRNSSNISKMSVESKQDEHSNHSSSKIEGFLQNVDPLKQNLIKSYYTLRLLKQRDMKCKMMQALNYFRAV